MCRKYGLQIPDTVHVGAGLMLPHALSIVVHYKAKLGKNCTICQFVTIAGDNEGRSPRIGDNCFIGAGAVIIGNITIGDNVTIGANAVVVKDVPDNATVVGVPARILHYKHPGVYVKNKV